MDPQDWSDKKSATKYLNRLPNKSESDYTRSDRRLAMDWVRARLKHENFVAPGDDAQQREWFFFLLQLARKRGRNSLVRYGFVEWCKRTYNTYGRIYGDAWKEAHEEGSRRTYARERTNAKVVLERKKTEAFEAGVKAARKKQAAEGGRAKYKNNPDAKAFVQHEWHVHREAYGGNKSAFARDYVRRVLNEYGVKVTEKTIREVWLSAQLRMTT